MFSSTTVHSFVVGLCQIGKRQAVGTTKGHSQKYQLSKTNTLLRQLLSNGTEHTVVPQYSFSPPFIVTEFLTEHMSIKIKTTYPSLP